MAKQYEKLAAHIDTLLGLGGMRDPYYQMGALSAMVQTAEQDRVRLNEYVEAYAYAVELLEGLTARPSRMLPEWMCGYCAAPEHQPHAEDCVYVRARAVVDAMRVAEITQHPAGSPDQSGTDEPPV